MTDDDEFLTPLRDLSRHVYHGRVLIREVDAPTAMTMVPESEEMILWHDWYNQTLYELSFSATSWSLAMNTLKAIAAKFPMAHCSIAANGTLRTGPGDWRSVE